MVALVVETTTTVW